MFYSFITLCDLSFLLQPLYAESSVPDLLCFIIFENRKFSLSLVYCKVICDMCTTQNKRVMCVKRNIERKNFHKAEVTACSYT